MENRPVPAVRTLQSRHQFIHGRVIGGQLAAGSNNVKTADERSDAVGCLQHQIHGRASQLQPVMASMFQDVFGGMGQFSDLTQADKPGASLDGVETAKDRIDAAVISRSGFELERDRFDRINVLDRLGDKLPEKSEFVLPHLREKLLGLGLSGWTSVIGLPVCCPRN